MSTATPPGDTAPQQQAEPEPTDAQAPQTATGAPDGFGTVEIPVAPPIPRPTVERADLWWMKSLVGLATAVAIGLLGFPLGWIWSSVSPWLPVTVGDGGLFYAQPEGEQRAAEESWFAIISVGAGIALAITVWIVLRRFRGSVTATALAIGGAAAGWLTWRFGHNIGRAHAFAVSRHAPNGTTIKFPVEMRIKNTGNIAMWHGWLPYVSGNLLLLAVTAVLTYVLIAGFTSRPDLAVRADIRPPFTL